MDAARDEETLSKIQTMWNTLRQAHAGSGPQVSDAQLRLLERYSPAIQRYLDSALRDADAAADVFQDFAVRFLRGAFGGANPAKGRFRDLLAVSLRNLVSDYWKVRKRQPQSLAAAELEWEADKDAVATPNREFLAAWRQQLLDLAWEALARHDRQTGHPLHLVLRFHIDNLEPPSSEAAKQLGARLNKAVSPSWVRKWLSRARARFGDLLLDETSRSLGDGRLEALEQELAELDLLDHCSQALERRRESILEE